MLSSKCENAKLIFFMIDIISCFSASADGRMIKMGGLDRTSAHICFQALGTKFYLDTWQIELVVIFKMLIVK